MNRLIVIGLIIMLFLITGLFLLLNYAGTLTGKAISSEYAVTKAICNETNFCQDYIITCENSSVISLEPITGAVIQHEKDWKDLRKNKDLCG
ncbi:hypothetical protein J4456_03905 [Candidatus Pacearchaeota archaeon]|nr:hypothetical protein [Candidatus Pacearchaeota archaeon]